MKNNTNFPTISVGIPTYEAGHSLIVTLQSLYAQSFYSQIDTIYLAVDGAKIKKSILSQIQNPKLQILYFEKRAGQAMRINDLFVAATSDLLILSNDDLVVDQKTVENILHITPNTFDLLMCNVDSLPAENILQRAIHAGKNINRRVYKAWNKGDNYLSCNGRFIVLSRDLYNNIRIPEIIWNNDAYMFLYAKINGYNTIYNDSVKAFYKTPSVVHEHTKQSNKFQLSFKENQQFFKKSIIQYYAIPKKLHRNAILTEFIHNPVFVIGYVFIYLYTRMYNKLHNVLPQKGYWETDVSTKVIG